MPERSTQLFFTRFYRATKALGKLLDEAVAAELKLDMREFMVLSCITKGTNYPSAIGKRLHANKFAVTRVLQKLEERGLVERTIDPDDSRRVLMANTVAGESARERAIAAMQARLEPIVTNLGAERGEQFLETLELIAELASQEVHA